MIACIAILCALVFPLTGEAQSNIIRAEYFYDTDPGFGNGSTISLLPGSTLNNVVFTSNTTALDPGVHQLFLRVQDAGGRWSITGRSLLYKPGSSSSFTPQIIKAEYFFDTDPGFGNGVNIVVTPGVQVLDKSVTADISSLSKGVHQMFIRVKDANGKWSISNRSFFYHPGNTNALTTPNLVKAEYFFDMDPGFGKGTNIPVSAGLQISDKSINADISSLNPGIHQMFIRVKDAVGNWSLSNRTFFYKLTDFNCNF